MSKHKNYLEANPEKDKTLYHICKELEINNGKTVINTDIVNWQETSRKLGKRAKPLIEHKPPLLYPIARTKNNRKNSLALIQTPNNVKIIEKKGNKTSFSQNKKNVNIKSFKILSNQLNTIAMGHLMSKHTSVQTYVGRNNQVYRKECIPKKGDISLYNISQIYFLKMILILI